MKLQRTINSMLPTAASRARRLWENMQELCDGPEFEQARDDYHAMFRVDSNFKPDTEPYIAD